MKNLIILFCVLVLSACSTHKLPVEYVGSSSPDWNKTSDAQQATVNFVGVNDKRGEGSDWLGAIRGGYGNVIKSLRTEKPISLVVEEVYVEALAARGLDRSSGENELRLSIDILKFDCSYYFNKEAHAHLELKLIDPSTGQVLYSKITIVDEKKGGVGAGVFGSVEALKDFAEVTLATAVDRSLDDQNFRKILLNTKSLGPRSSDTGTRQRLRELDRLKEDGLISEDEYSQKRQEILREL